MMRSRLPSTIPPNKRLELTEVPTAIAGQVQIEIKAIAKYLA